MTPIFLLSAIDGRELPKTKRGKTIREQAGRRKSAVSLWVC